MFCENCGAKIPDGARFCDQCGRPAAAPPAAPPAKGMPPPLRPPDLPGARPPSPPAPLPPPPKAPPAGQPQMPRPPEPARPSVGDLPLVPSAPVSSPPATPRGGSLPAMPRTPQASPGTSATEDARTQGIAPPPALPNAPRAGFPLPRIDADAGQGMGRSYVPTAPVPDVNLPQAVTFLLIDTNAPLVLAGHEQYVIGREDPEQGVFPDVDLTLSGGEAAGVSRRHAVLAYRNGTYWLEDQDSLNYTFVNGVRLDPRQPHPLRDGDEVWFARLRARFFLGSTTPDPWR